MANTPNEMEHIQISPFDSISHAKLPVKVFDLGRMYGEVNMSGQ